MKYDHETTTRLGERYHAGVPIPELALEFGVSERSIIAKLSSMGEYQRKAYLSKTGEPPIKKEVYIDRIATLLGTNIELLDSLEKVNKSVLKMIQDALSEKE
jgi:hypothetical protein